MGKYNDEKFDYDLSIFSSKTVRFLKYALRESQNRRLREAGGVSKYRLIRFLDIVYCFLCYGATTYNYVDYKFYKLNSHQRDQFLTLRRRIKLMQKRFDFKTYTL